MKEPSISARPEIPVNGYFGAMSQHEQQRIAADLRINNMKRTAELRQRDDHRALVLQVQEGPAC